jgi:lysozyme family protein
MADFNEAYELTMRAEGGYVNDPDDRGGETYKGISRKNNPKWDGWKTIDAIKATKPKSLNVALGKDEKLLLAIKDFYKRNYWDVNRTGDINDQQTANQLFDSAVNTGAGTAARFLQQAAGVHIDGQVGPITIGAVNSANKKDFYERFISYRKGYYNDIIARHPEQQKFQKSWFSRLGPYQDIA